MCGSRAQHRVVEGDREGLDLVKGETLAKA